MVYRQGDVLLLSTEAELTDGKSDPNGLFLAEGSSSAHEHRVFGDAKLGGNLLLVGEGGAELRVVGGDRHAPITLAPGVYEIRIQRRYTSDGYSVRVED